MTAESEKIIRKLSGNLTFLLPGISLSQNSPSNKYINSSLIHEIHDYISEFREEYFLRVEKAKRLRLRLMRSDARRTTLSPDKKLMRVFFLAAN